MSRARIDEYTITLSRDEYAIVMNALQSQRDALIGAAVQHPLPEAQRAYHRSAEQVRTLVERLPRVVAEAREDFARC